MLSGVYFFLLCIMAPKRRSWHGLVGTHGISDTALAAVLTHCKKTPIEENCGTDRRTIYRAIEDSYSKVASKIQLPLKDGTVWDWHIARLDKMLQILCAESSKLRFVISMALKHARDESVLEMISYLDEVIPGNALKPDNGRKTWAIYITCKPQWMLQLEDCWLCVAVIRTGIASEIDGNVSSCMRCLWSGQSEGHFNETKVYLQQFAALLHACAIYTDIEEKLFISDRADIGWASHISPGELWR